MNFNTSNNPERQEVHMVTEMSFYVLLFDFQLPYQPAPKEVADKVIEKSKNK